MALVSANGVPFLAKIWRSSANDLISIQDEVLAARGEPLGDHLRVHGEHGEVVDDEDLGGQSGLGSTAEQHRKIVQLLTILLVRPASGCRYLDNKS